MGYIKNKESYAGEVEEERPASETEKEPVTEGQSSMPDSIMTPIAFFKMDEFVLNTTRLGLTGLRNEHEELTRNNVNPVASACIAWQQNMNRNRYRDVPCLDASRVILKQNVPPDTDYINGSTVRIEGVDKHFIATQGPLENTASDFWRMVYQMGETGSPAILMLGKFVEDGIAKCFQYWPVTQGSFKNYGCMTITNKKTEFVDRYTIYTLEVLPDGCSNSVIGTLYHHTDWPDKGLPKSPMGLLRLLKNLRQNKLVPGVWIVHCSAGLGRSGTLLAIEIGLQQLMRGCCPKIKDIVKKIREQRPGSIKTPAQYVFIFACLLYYCHAKGTNCKVIADFHASFSAAIGSNRL